MKKRLTVDGMTNGHSVTHIKTALQGINGVNNVDVHLKSNIVIVDGTDSIEDSEMKSAIENAGFNVSKIEEA
ncbi:MAG: copper ion binding protein [Clostridiaceae bacterium]|jgi:copper chaperone CopZ|nr:copper ion binding protein [Clostridiaceae bacterium]